MKIVLAIDGSEQSEAAVEDIARRHWPEASEVRIVSIVERPCFPDSLSGAEMNMSPYVAIENTLRERARAAVDKAAATLRADVGSRHLTVTTEVLSGSPKQVILEEADAFDADLVVVGSHGHGRLARFLLGSVSQAVALHARCSVEIVRSPIHEDNRKQGAEVKARAV